MSAGAPQVERAGGESDARRSAWLLAAGLGIGFLGSLCGIGGGLFAVPFLHVVRGFELQVAVASSLVLVLATTVGATAAEAFQEASDLHGPLVAGLVGGVLLGAQAGFRVSERLPARRLKMVFVVVLTLAAIRLGPWPQAPAGPGGGALFEPGAASLAVAFLVGAGGGFVAPLLGVGGGLIMVPGLYLGIPGLGFSTARATSLAAGSVAAARSLWLHARAGRVRWRSATWLAAGALLGAVLGVRTTRLAGVADLGRILLALVLLFVALRFARELWWRARAPGAQA